MARSTENTHRQWEFWITIKEARNTFLIHISSSSGWEAKSSQKYLLDSPFEFRSVFLCQTYSGIKAAQSEMKLLLMIGTITDWSFKIWFRLETVISLFLTLTVVTCSVHIWQCTHCSNCAISEENKLLFSSCFIPSGTGGCEKLYIQKYFQVSQIVTSFGPFWCQTGAHHILFPLRKCHFYTEKIIHQRFAKKHSHFPGPTQQASS